MTWFWLGAWLATVSVCAVVRNRRYAVSVGVLTGAMVLSWTTLFSAPSLVSYVAWVLSGLVFVHYLRQLKPRMRSFAYRALVQWPALWFMTGSILALPWAFAAALGLPPIGWWIPYVAATVGLIQSLTHRPSTLDLVLDGTLTEELARVAFGEPTAHRPLRIAHITDTHIGPFVSERRLRRSLSRVVEQQPDLVLLTGDFLTTESNGDAELLERAFAPLKGLHGRVFACRGNHDHECPETVAEAFRNLGIRLLIDEGVVVETAGGPVQVVGIDFKFRDAKRRVRQACEAISRVAGCPRIVLLHHPGHFVHLPDGMADLVLSGHTHGGQVGLVDLGLDITMMRLFVKMPDHGFWGFGRNRLYVNRGLGHYGFPLRIGVRAEEALLQVHVARSGLTG